jgi:hypothetical protein
MKVYRVYVDDWDYDEFDAVVVVAENEDKALAMVENGYYDRCYFEKWQGEIHVEEVDLTYEHVVLESFNAG